MTMPVTLSCTEAQTVALKIGTITVRDKLVNNLKKYKF